MTKKDPCATTNDKHGVREKASEEGTGLLLACEQRRARVSLPPLAPPNVQTTGLQQGVAALGVGEHHCLGVGLMAMESIWQRGCGYRVLGGKGVW